MNKKSCQNPYVKADTKKSGSNTGFLMAGATRLELATPCVTGMYSNQLNYAPVTLVICIHNKNNKCKNFFYKLFIFFIFIVFLST